MTDPNPFTQALPTQLRAWDSTALRSYLTCPRRYQYEIVNGWRRDNTSLRWGSLYHGAVEEYDECRCRGLSKAEALEVAFAWALENSGDRVVIKVSDDGEGEGEIWKPWGSTWTSFWRCTDEGPLLKSGPNKGQPNEKKRCHNAKFEQEGVNILGTCPECGKPTEVVERWVHADPAKNRHSLLRALVWYVDEQSEEGGVQPYTFPDGRPGVELSFQVPLPINTPDGEPYILCGHMDSFVTAYDEVGVRERKTTATTIGSYYFDRYSPDVQIDTYDLVASVLFPELAAKWVMLEATQTGANFARFHRHFIRSTEGRREEHLKDIINWIKRAEADAAAGYYPTNKASCYSHGGCPFRDICTKDPSTRETWLAASFVKNHWNPLKTRGAAALEPVSSAP